jgi:predicted metalloprotease with PDZ domain
MRKQAMLLSLGVSLWCSALMVPSHAFMLTGGVEENVVEEKVETVKVREPGVVGVELEVPSRGYPSVRKVFRHSPAEKAGLSTGDMILAIDGQPARDKSREQLDEAISDVPGTIVVFTVKGDRGNRLVHLTVAPLSSIPRGNRYVYDWVPSVQQRSVSQMGGNLPTP